MKTINPADTKHTEFTQERRFERNLALVREISWALTMIEGGYARPGSRFALQAACATGIIVQAVGLYIQTFTNYSGLGWSNLGLSILLAILMYQAVSFFRPGPSSYSSIIFSLLSEYEPIDKEAYRVLQEQVRSTNDWDAAVLKEWIDTEKLALGGARKTLPPEAVNFLNKEV